MKPPFLAELGSGAEWVTHKKELQAADEAVRSFRPNCSASKETSAKNRRNVWFQIYDAFSWRAFFERRTS